MQNLLEYEKYKYEGKFVAQNSSLWQVQKAFAYLIVSEQRSTPSAALVAVNATQKPTE